MFYFSLVYVSEIVHLIRKSGCKHVFVCPKTTLFISLALVMRKWALITWRSFLITTCKVYCYGLFLEGCKWDWSEQLDCKDFDEIDKPLPIRFSFRNRHGQFTMIGECKYVSSLNFPDKSSCVLQDEHVFFSIGLVLVLLINCGKTTPNALGLWRVILDAMSKKGMHDPLKLINYPERSWVAANQFAISHP